MKIYLLEGTMLSNAQIDGFDHQIPTYGTKKKKIMKENITLLQR